MRPLSPNTAAVMFFAMLIVSCNNVGEPRKKSNIKQADESLVKANRYLVKQEKEEIENYIRRHGWEMNETGSGLQYFIIEKGNGEPTEKGKVAILDYTTKLISGDLVYSSTEDGFKAFNIGHGGVESGLEELVLLLRVGDKARAILPSHLAYGLLGDDKKIPSRATLIYEIELIELK